MPLKAVRFSNKSPSHFILFFKVPVLLFTKFKFQNTCGQELIVKSDIYFDFNRLSNIALVRGNKREYIF